eukprot:TRINITY_DN1738_c0_g1_i4.p1 TRINITY_DN1738_c0_g1~~TRINITY_DN1738_c0_g1_i4.p1  ORF type:complete len:206 (+),score=-33.69 TRINITY_DN1738_c0_g1_i4:328-945(+)
MIVSQIQTISYLSQSILQIDINRKRLRLQESKQVNTILLIFNLICINQTTNIVISRNHQQYNHHHQSLKSIESTIKVPKIKIKNSQSSKKCSVRTLILPIQLIRTSCILYTNNSIELNDYYTNWTKFFCSAQAHNTKTNIYFIFQVKHHQQYNHHTKVQKISNHRQRYKKKNKKLQILEKMFYAYSHITNIADRNILYCIYTQFD